MWLMRQILLMIALVVLVGLCLPAAGAGRPENEERPAIVEKTIRMQLKKPKGKLTKADLEKVVSLNLNFTKITDEGLKELPKLKQLTYLRLFSTQITDSSLKELAKQQQLTAIDLDLYSPSFGRRRGGFSKVSYCPSAIPPTNRDFS